MTREIGFYLGIVMAGLAAAFGLAQLAHRDAGKQGRQQAQKHRQPHAHAVLALDHERRTFDAAQRGKQPEDEDDE